jgi:integrase
MDRSKFTKRKSQKGERFTADYIEYEKAMLKGNELLWSEKQMIIGFYIIFSINSGLRVSDVLSRKHSELLNIRSGDYLNVTEKKTKKFREIQINSKIVEAYQYLVKRLKGSDSFNPDDYIFKSAKGTVYAIPSLNTILKEVFKGYAEHVSTHSLRKSFGRHVYEINGRSEDCLIKLSELFQHSSMAITRLYLGIRKEELGNIYMNL